MCACSLKLTSVARTNFPKGSFVFPKRATLSFPTAYLSLALNLPAWSNNTWQGELSKKKVSGRDWLINYLEELYPQLLICEYIYQKCEREVGVIEDWQSMQESFFLLSASEARNALWGLMTGIFGIPESSPICNDTTTSRTPSRFPSLHL
jgi:hypothetical protein